MAKTDFVSNGSAVLTTVYRRVNPIPKMTASPDSAPIALKQKRFGSVEPNARQLLRFRTRKKFH